MPDTSPPGEGPTPTAFEAGEVPTTLAYSGSERGGLIALGLMLMGLGAMVLAFKRRSMGWE